MIITHEFFDGNVPAEARKIRQDVFMTEQGFSYEFDENDYISVHILLCCDGVPAGTGRLFKDKDGSWHVGRIAVRKEFRGKNLGAEVMYRIEDKARELGADKIVLSAQCRVRGFYEKCGYTAYGEVYLDEYCEHIRMEKSL